MICIYMATLICTHIRNCNPICTISRVWGRGGEEVSEVIYHCSTGNDSSGSGAATASATPSDQPRGSPLTKQLPSTATTPSDQPPDIPVTTVDPSKQPESPSTTAEAANVTIETLKLDKQIQNLENQFWDIVDKAAKHLETTRLSDLQRCVTQLPVSVKYQHVGFLEGNRLAINDTKSVNEIFSILALYWDFLNCGLLDVIVCRLGNDETKQLMEQYKEKLREFRMKTKLGDYIGKGKESNPRLFTEFTTELGDDWRERTLEDLEEFRIEQARSMQVEKYALSCTRIKLGSVSVTWALPSSLPGIADTLQSILPRLKKEYDVLMVVFQGKHIPELSELAPQEVSYCYYET